MKYTFLNLILTHESLVKPELTIDNRRNAQIKDKMHVFKKIARIPYCFHVESVVTGV